MAVAKAAAMARREAGEFGMTGPSACGGTAQLPKLL